MGFRRSFQRLMVRAAVGVLAWIDAGQRYSPDRSSVPGWVQDARFDVNAATRDEILRKSRYLADNCGLLQRMGDIFVQYVAGPNGNRFTPASSDATFNTDAGEYWAEWSAFADISSRMSLGEIQGVAVERWFHDGEVFILKTRGESGRPRVQLIESHRVQTPWDRYQQGNIHDGVEVDANGRPVFYWVRDTFDGDKFRRIPANRIIHVFSPTRPGQLRGLPFCTSVIPLLIDFMDLQALEMRVAKTCARIANVIKRLKGSTAGAGLDEARLRREIVENKVTKPDGTTYLKQRAQHVESVLGGDTVALEEGEDIQQFKTDRPSVVTQQYWEFLIALICAGTGINKSLVLPYSLQGTVARGDLDVAASFFRAHSAILQRCFAEVYAYVIGDAIDYGKLGRRAAPADWRKVNSRAPRTPNVDVGRNSKALIEEYESGFRTLESVCAETGDDWREVVIQRTAEAKFIVEQAKAAGVDPSMVSIRIMDRPERIQSEQSQMKPKEEAFAA